MRPRPLDLISEFRFNSTAVGDKSPLLMQTLEALRRQGPTLPDSTRPFHVEVLYRELQRRKQRHPRYSLRAFAHQLKVDSATLSRILAAKEDLSLRSALKIVQALDLGPEEKCKFELSVAEQVKEKATRYLGERRFGCGCPRLASRATLPEPKIADSDLEMTCRKVIFIDSRRIQEARQYFRKFVQALSDLCESSSSGQAIELQLTPSQSAAEPGAMSRSSNTRIRVD